VRAHALLVRSLLFVLNARGEGERGGGIMSCKEREATTRSSQS